MFLEPAEPETVWYTTPLPEFDFSNAPWDKFSVGTRRALFHQTLVGLARIHDHGMIHGRICPESLVLVRLNNVIRCQLGHALYFPDRCFPLLALRDNNVSSAADGCHLSVNAELACQKNLKREVSMTVAQLCRESLRCYVKIGHKPVKGMVFELVISGFVLRYGGFVLACLTTEPYGTLIAAWYPSRRETDPQPAKCAKDIVLKSANNGNAVNIANSLMMIEVFVGKHDVWRLDVLVLWKSGLHVCYSKVSINDMLKNLLPDMSRHLGRSYTGRKL
jgi:hypothetical protein